jgi:LysM repeat protein
MADKTLFISMSLMISNLSRNDHPRISSPLLQRAIARTRRFVYFCSMSFWFRIYFSVLAIGLGLTLGGCSPSDQSQLDEEKEPHFVLGNSRVNAMDYQGAIEAFQESLEVNPRSASAHFRLACLYDTKESDPAAAIYHYQEYLRLDPKADNAEVITQRIYSCKQQLATDVLQMPSAPAAQLQLEKLVEQNHELQRQVDTLKELVKQWINYANQKAAQPNPSPVPNNTQPVIASSPSPDDISSQPSITSQPAPAKNSGPAASPKLRTHTVVAGETLAAIARKSGVSLNSLLAANPGLNPKKLRVGQPVNLPQ